LANLWHVHGRRIFILGHEIVVTAMVAIAMCVPDEQAPTLAAASPCPVEMPNAFMPWRQRG
jgi:hypothetical protein